VKAVAIQRFGSPEGLTVTDLPDPVPAAGQVLIATGAIGVGGVDAVIRRGTVTGPGFAEGHVPGSEVAGTVTAVGHGVDPSWTGRRVWAFTGLGGGYAEQALAPVEEILPLPADLSDADAVTLGSSGVVAHFALAHAHFTAGESVLVRGAAGSLGVMTVQLAARGGAGAVAVTTSSAERGDRLRGLGATHVLDRAGDGPGSYDVVIDVVAGADLPSFVDRLGPNGRMVAVGIVGGYPPPARPERAHGGRRHRRRIPSGRLRRAPAGGVPEVGVVRHVQRGHRARVGPAGRAGRAVRRGGSRRTAVGRARGAAAGAGPAGPPENGRR
jgi:NADPH:quinone reductase-like Zn-dependent oxidoreductase